jgi:hypothetical protein
MLVVLGEALSKQNAPFVKLTSLSNNTPVEIKSPVSPQVSAVAPAYRMTRRFPPMNWSRSSISTAVAYRPTGVLASSAPIATPSLGIYGECHASLAPQADT